MIALVDCNSFYCSVEKVFHPGLEGKAVCVLSSNDGCIVALTPEAKALGLKRGTPIFQVSEVLKQNEVHLFSTNMQLYAAMSKRVTNILRKSIARVENYSIDESFCYLDGYEKYHHLEDLMRQTAQRIKLYTDIPVSVGIAPSKTLAKMGSKFAKKYRGYRGVCMIDTEEKRRKALELFSLDDVWGIGRHTLEKLNRLGIYSPLEFADKRLSWVKNNFTKPGVQTWMELNGCPCIDTQEVIQNQSICTSRSFGQMVTDLASLKASIATFASSCANKLRGQSQVAGTVTVFVSSNRFREDLLQYRNAVSRDFLVPTSDTLEIVSLSLQLLQEIYYPGVWYKKTGVILSDLHPVQGIQTDLFDTVQNRKERKALMKAVDSINHRYGAKSLQLAVEGGEDQPWKVKHEHQSPNYLTNIREILTIHI